MLRRPLKCTLCSNEVITSTEALPLQALNQAIASAEETTGTINVFRQSIVIGIPDSSGGSGNPVLGKTLVIDNADILRAVIRMMNPGMVAWIKSERWILLALEKDPR